jgi:hypothetical protein
MKWNIKNSLIHDVECYINFFSDIFKIPYENKLTIFILYSFNNIEERYKVCKEITKKLSDYEINFIFTVKELKDFVENIILLGYNSHYYDNPMLNCLFEEYESFQTSNNIIGLVSFLKIQSNKIIKEESRKYKYLDYTQGIDLSRVSGCDRIYKPLKQVAANLRHPKIQDLPIKHTKSITIEEIVEIIYYELNDVLITEKLLIGIPETDNPLVPKTAFKGLIQAIEFRQQMTDIFGINILDNNKSQIGEKLAKNLYSRTSGRDIDDFKDLQTKRDFINYSDVIFPNISFKTEALQDFLIKLKQLVYEPSKKPEKGKKSKKSVYMEQFYFTLELFDLIIEFKQGGLHAIHSKNKQFNSSKLRKDIDGTSYYPFLYTKYHIEPEHLEHFAKFVEYLITLRVNFKKEGNKVASNGIKIPINRTFGGYGDKTSWMYDELALLKTTINGQLFLLMLIESLWLNGIRCFYANTDGITVELEEIQIELFNRLCKDWETITLMQLEYTDYKECYIRDVNNYIVVASDKLKLKGDYEYTGYIEKYGEFDVTGSFSAPIVPYAVVEYLINKKPLIKTLKEHLNYKDGIYDFCYSNKTGSQFKNILFTLNGSTIKKETIQQSIRYFISKSNQKLFKIKLKTEKELLKLLKEQNKNKNSKSVYFFIEHSYIAEDLLKQYSHLKSFKLTDGYLFIKKSKELFGEDGKLDYLSYTDVSVGRNITLFNDYFPSNDYNIDFEYYLNECNKLLEGLKNKKINLKINKQLNLF